MFFKVNNFRTSLLPVLLLTVAVLSVSCSSSVVEYEPYPVYPARHDPIVVSNPSSIPNSPAPGGQLDVWLADHAKIGGLVVAPNRLTETQRRDLSAALDAIFGTPPNPTFDSPHAESLGLTAEALAHGSRLYRRHCANCHGLTGDGRGPAGLFVFPHARDLRQGLMKFGSTPDGTPTRGDLTRVIKLGVPGTSMPPFGLADVATIEQLVTATIHLSIRGNVERNTMMAILSDDPPGDIAGEVRAQFDRIVSRWVSAKAAPLPAKIPELTDEHIRRGHELFSSAKTGCVSCHGDYGRMTTYRYDAWGTAAKVADLTDRQFRGGGEPAELFRRIRLGIPTVGMPAQGTLSDYEVWDLVAFVSALPRPMNLPADVRGKVYPNR
jgi:mono/diheme cytochrome c family protein